MESAPKSEILRETTLAEGSGHYSKHHHASAWLTAHTTDGAVPVRPRHRIWLPLKFALEWGIAAALSVVALPLLVTLGVAVRLTSAGPALYGQRRLGRGGRAFTVWKLRTMRHDCERQTGPVWSTPGDARVTRLGRFLRDTHLDELPQLWSVLTGTMSLIGPRPERPEIACLLREALPGYDDRLAVRPGITGLAQMRLAADADLDHARLKLAYDLYYVRHTSPGLDLRVAISTPLYLLEALTHAASNALVGSYGSEIDRRLGRTPTHPGAGIASPAMMAGAGANMASLSAR